MTEIRVGDRVLARDARGEWLERIAVSEIIDGEDFPVVWVTTEAERDKAEAEGRRSRGVAVAVRGREARMTAYSDEDHRHLLSVVADRAYQRGRAEDAEGRVTFLEDSLRNIGVCIEGWLEDGIDDEVAEMALGMIRGTVPAPVSSGGSTERGVLGVGGGKDEPA